VSNLQTSPFCFANIFGTLPRRFRHRGSFKGKLIGIKEPTRIRIEKLIFEGGVSMNPDSEAVISIPDPVFQERKNCLKAAVKKISKFPKLVSRFDKLPAIMIPEIA